MKAHVRHRFVAAIAGAALLPVPSAQAATFRLDSAAQPVEWTVWHDESKLLTYDFRPGKFKPYLKELATISGENLLRDAPYDHLHHHALMFGIRVNGVNFWEETHGSGVQKVVRSPEPEFVSVPGNGQAARIRQEIHWLSAEEAFLPDSARSALLVEHRTLLLTTDDKNREVALEWRSDFEVGQKTNVVALTGANYHGLGVRFRADLDSSAAHFLAGRSIDLDGNRQDVSAASWAAVKFGGQDQGATLALIGHPSNQRGDPVFFSMKTPFAYLSATQGLDKQPMIFRAGEHFTLRYLVLVYPEDRSTTQLERRAQSWRQAR